jgi:DNA-binding transcriptional regulator YhcF (GntR family)
MLIQTTSQGRLPIYRQIVDQIKSAGLINKRRGAGTFDANVTSPLTLKERRQIIGERIDTLLAEASRLNFTFEDWQGLMNKGHELMQQPKPGKPLHTKAG